MIEKPLRLRRDISEDWEFTRGRVSRRWLRGGGEGGKSVDLPHCWNRRDTFQPGRHSYSGKGAYRRVIDLPASPEAIGTWRIRSEGFYGFGDLWIDGRAVAVIDGQYLGIDVGLPASLEPGNHVIALRLENLFQRRVLPGRRDPDFLLYGGLAGRVWLERVPALHIDETATEVVCTPGPDGAEILELRCRALGLETSATNPRLTWVIADEGGDIAAAGPSPVTDGPTSVSTMILGPRCWTPNDPHLYWADVRLETDDGPADAVRVRFGITRAEFRPEKGFFLDGARIDLHGCNRHESIPGLGNALPEELHRADAELLKNYGCNFVRLSHCPQHPAFLDACDELGILAYAEIATWKSVRSSSSWRRAARRQMRDLILRDRHHPSIILWGMGNESRSRVAYRELSAIARQLDPARPVTYAENHLYRARREKTVGIPEVWSVNYELEKLAEARDACSLRNVVVTECCNYPYAVRGDDGAELTQVATLEYEWGLMAGRPYLAGHSVWCFADYATEHRDRFRRLNGLFDAWRQPKMAAELFRTRYADEPFISLFLTGRDSERQLHVFTNCRDLRLERDGAPPVALEARHHQAVPLAEPFTCITVKGEREGVAASNELRMWKEAAAVRLEFAGPPAQGVTVPLDLTIVDCAGVRVLDWNGQVHVSAHGGAHLMPYNDAREVRVARGKGRTYLRFDDAKGMVEVSVTIEGGPAGSETISIAPGAPRNGSQTPRSRA